MRKLFLAAILLAGVSMNAKVWRVTTSCGVIGTINVADNVTVQQLTDAIGAYNLLHCGVYPTRVTITSSTL